MDSIVTAYFLDLIIAEGFINAFSIIVAIAK